MFWVTTIALLTVYTIHLGLSFLKHKTIARTIGLPCIIYPISEFNEFYMILFEARLVLYVVNTWLPRDVADYIYNTTFKYRWAVKDRMCRSYGGVYLYATPGSVNCHVSDAAVVTQISRARQSFPKEAQQYESIEIYGPNIITSEGSQWLNHRRYTSAAFSEKNIILLWQEATRQATEMLGYWVDQYSQNTPPSEFTLSQPRDDIFKLALNTPCSAGYGVQLPFKPMPQGTTKSLFTDSIAPPPGYRSTFRAALTYIDKNVTSIFLTISILPRWLTRALGPLFKTNFEAYENLGRYFHALLARAERNEGRAHNLLEGLVRGRREERERMTDSEARQDQGLSDEEVFGNLYIFTLAGHETVATTLRYAFVLLALHQNVQDKLYEDILEATRDKDLGPAVWDYTRVFPKLVTPLCVMLEILRLFPPVVALPKSTGDSTATITYNGQPYHLPPRTTVTINSTALHYSEKYWGADAATFNPYRWDKRNRTSFLAKNDGVEGLAGPGLEYDTIHRPVRGSYVPFNDGARACVGRKFSQVEFVVVLAVIFREYRVSLDRDGGRLGEEEVRGRAKRIIQESSSFITLGMNRDVPLLLQKR